jgi:hypothetical protein
MSYVPVATDDASLGYTAQDVLDAVNESAEGSLTWYDGMKTKLRFAAQLATAPGLWETGVAVYDPPPGGCFRRMRIGIQATFVTDDGRLQASISGAVTAQDEGGPFDINHVAVAILEGSFDDSDGPLASAVPALIGVPAADCQYRFELMLKGATCSWNCDPGVSGCLAPGGTLSVQGTDYAAMQCASANVAKWTWD